MYCGKLQGSLPDDVDLVNGPGPKKKKKVPAGHLAAEKNLQKGGQENIFSTVALTHFPLMSFLSQLISRCKPLGFLDGIHILAGHSYPSDQSSVSKSHTWERSPRSVK